MSLGWPHRDRRGAPGLPVCQTGAGLWPGLNRPSGSRAHTWETFFASDYHAQDERRSTTGSELLDSYGIFLANDSAGVTTRTVSGIPNAYPVFPALEHPFRTYVGASPALGAFIFLNNGNIHRGTPFLRTHCCIDISFP